ncbi:MAG: hypothetical protein NTX44_02035 [Ignavibacteriales bacterium]|nr:hypothetical protein [Ignavibacteriales bacterium]
MIYVLAISLLIGYIADAQTTTQVVTKITASANVVGNVDLIVMKDLEFEVGNLSPTDLIVDPQRDSHSGQIKIVGSPNSLVRITNEKQSILQHENGKSQLYFTYNVSGSTDNVQQKSVILTQKNEVKLSDGGLYYLWVGGQLSGLENIIPGNYTMELKIDVEYIL